VRDYLRKGKSPCDDFNISSDNWEAFKKEKETPEFQVRTQKLLIFLYFPNNLKLTKYIDDWLHRRRACEGR
jgi:predicted DNA-binding transcriptional regulator YafY